MENHTIISNNKRNYGIDLLRLVLMYMVCVLHTLGQGGILNASEGGSIGYKTFWLIEIMAYCAVDGFALISGYMATGKPRRFEKLADMWFQVFFYSFIVTGFLTLMGVNEYFGKAEMIECALPVTFGKFWYFTAFFALFFAIPILDKFVFSINECIAKKALLIAIFLYSILGIVMDPFMSRAGYSALWLMVLYVVGALARKIRLFETRKTVSLIITWMVCILITWIVQVWGNGILTNYISPTILLSGLIMVILFSRIHLKGTVISKLSPLAFGIYLFQLNQVIWKNVIGGAFTFVAEKNIVVGVIYVLCLAAIIFMSGLLVEFMRNAVAKLIRIPHLCNAIVKLAHTCLEKTAVLLK